MPFNLKYWTDLFFSANTEELSRGKALIYVQLLYAEANPDADNVKKIIETVSKEFLYRVIEQRAKALGLTISPATCMFLMMLTENPGNAIMYLVAIRSRTSSIDMNGLTQLFPSGYLTKEALSELWLAQKHVGQNMLDCLDVHSFT